ncbi:MAG: transcriptional repressor LexA [Anaerovoracaceae bacterium]|nr:transcriptional repressor LexA [Bacillota bacterium]MDY2671502.1 transcriptional repressor LexA [Anaerovoracaceae bacterium]
MGRKALPTDDMNLTEREHKVLDFLEDIIGAKGYPPTVREICSHFNIKSTSTIHRDLASLEEKGFISKDPDKPRTIEVLKSGRPERNGIIGDTGTSVSEFERADISEVPLVGQVAAGTPILAEQNITEYFPVPARFASGTYNYFMLKVKGESMIEAGIFSGDYILVRQQNDADNGDIVVAMIDGFESEATVKTFYREKDHVRLQPENSSMSPIIVRDVKILGLVKGVFRYM